MWIVATPKIAGFQADVGMHRHQIAIGQDTLDVDGLLWKLGCILLHGRTERFGSTLKVRVVMTKTRADILLISFLHFPRTGQTQEAAAASLRAMESALLGATLTSPVLEAEIEAERRFFSRDTPSNGLSLSGERQAVGGQRAPQLVEGVRPDAVQLRDLGFAEFGELLKPVDAGPGQRSSRRGGQLDRKVAFPPVLLFHRAVCGTTYAAGGCTRSKSLP